MDEAVFHAIIEQMIDDLAVVQCGPVDFSEGSCVVICHDETEVQRGYSVAYVVLSHGDGWDLDLMQIHGDLDFDGAVQHFQEATS